VELLNPTATEASLVGMALIDKNGLGHNKQLILGKTGCPSSLGAGAYLLLCRDGSAVSGGTFYPGCGFEFGIQSKDTLELYTNLSMASPFDVTTGCCTGSTTTSFGRNSVDGSGGFAELSSRTPGAPNVIPPIVINEVADRGIPSEPCAGEDWIELYNPTALAVSITGMLLTDSNGIGHTRQLVLGRAGCPSTLASNAYLLLCRDGAAIMGRTSYDGCGFGFGVGGTDTIALFADNQHAAPLDVATGCCSKSLTSSYGRHSANGSGSFQILRVRTPGAANTGPAAPAAPPPPPVEQIIPSTLIINEVADVGASDDMCAGGEWIEIFNPTGATWALPGIAIVDGQLGGRGTVKQLQLGTPQCPQSLAPGKLLVLCMNGAVFVGRQPNGNSFVPWDETFPSGCSFSFRIATTDTISLYSGTSAPSSTPALLDATVGCCTGSSATSYGRMSADGTGGFSALSSRSPGRVNALVPPSPPPTPEPPSPYLAPLSSPISLGVTSSSSGNDQSGVIVVLTVLVVILAAVAIALVAIRKRRVAMIKTVKMQSSSALPAEITLGRPSATVIGDARAPRA